MKQPDYSIWCGEQLWRLFQAVSLVVGIEPPVTIDDIHRDYKNKSLNVIWDAIPDQTVRDNWHRLYKDAKAACDLGKLTWYHGRSSNLYLLMNVEPKHFAEWAESRGVSLPLSLAQSLNLVGDAPKSMQRGNPASSKIIMELFQVRNDAKENEAWWNERMRKAKTYGLISARASAGRGKKQSFWYAAEIASWLIEKRHLNKGKVIATLRRSFPECTEIADWLDETYS